MQAKLPEFLIQILEEQYGKETTAKIIRRLSSKKKNHISCQHPKSQNRRNKRNIRTKSNKIQDSKME